MSSSAMSTEEDEVITMTDEDDDFETADADGDGGWDDVDDTADNNDIDLTDAPVDVWEEKRVYLLKKEQEVRQQLTEQQQLDKRTQDLFVPEACARLILHSLISMMQADKAGSSGGVHPTPVDDNIYRWNIKLDEFDAESEMSRSLAELKQRYNYDYVEVELNMPPALFPYYPPTLRVVRPRLQHYLSGRLTTLPMFGLNAWSPITSIKDIIDTVRQLLNDEGVVDVTHDDLNDPDSDLPAYTALEFQLLRLSTLLEIAPRAHQTVSAPASTTPATAATPKAKSTATPIPHPHMQSKTAKEIESATKKSSAKPASKLPQAADVPELPAHHTRYNRMAAGTGYSSHADASRTAWDPAQWRAAQQRRNDDVQAVFTEVLTELRQSKLPPTVDEVLELSVLLPALHNFLKADSLIDVHNSPTLYSTLYELVLALCKHPSLYYLFLLPDNQSNGRSLHDLTEASRKTSAMAVKFASAVDEPDELAEETKSDGVNDSKDTSLTSKLASAVSWKQVTSAAKRVKEAATTTSSASESAEDQLAASTLNKLILRACTAVNDAVKELHAKTQAAAASKGKKNKRNISAVAVSPSSSSTAQLTSGEEKSDTAEVNEQRRQRDYIAAMTALNRLDEVEGFEHHKYLTSNSHVTPTRDAMRRLASEYADLSTSLPIEHDTSVFVRVDSERINYVQMLIIAPYNTPYSLGCFLFDAMFPAGYPAGPPSVNLQTTGGGTVRYNPNLYDSGKVCLSLLGTWQGNKGENWLPAASTFLQVAVSIQSLIFIDEPYFNEPGYQSSYGTESGKASSKAYNDNIQVQTLKWAVLEQCKNPPKHFEQIVRTHFRLQQHRIVALARKWAETNSSVTPYIAKLEAQFAELH